MSYMGREDPDKAVHLRGLGDQSRCCLLQSKWIVLLVWLLMLAFAPITKAYLYNFDPLKPHFYIVKLGFTGVYIIFLISIQKHRWGGSNEYPQWRGGSNEYPQSMFWAEIWKVSEFFIWKFSLFWWWNFQYIWIGVFSYCNNVLRAHFPYWPPPYGEVFD